MIFEALLALRIALVRFFEQIFYAIIAGIASALFLGVGLFLVLWFVWLLR